MPATATAARLNSVYHVAQGRAAAAGAGEVLLAMRELLDFRDLDGTFPAYLSVALRLVMDNHQAAAALGAEYYRLHRISSGVTDPLDPVLILPDGRQIARSLLITGPVAAKRAMRQTGSLAARFAAAQAAAESLTAGSVFRLVANGSRDTLMATMQEDPRVQRYSRVTDGDPCDFCDMLAGRGAVYLSEDTAAGSEYHDRCNCYPEPEYT